MPPLKAALIQHPFTTVAGFVMLVASGVLLCPSGLVSPEVQHHAQIVVNVAGAIGLGGAADAVRRLLAADVKAVAPEEGKPNGA